MEIGNESRCCHCFYGNSVRCRRYKYILMHGCRKAKLMGLRLIKYSCTAQAKSDIYDCFIVNFCN